MDLIKKYWVYCLIILACIGAYIVTVTLQNQKIIAKTITYSSSSAPELYIVWGINYLQLPPRQFWPDNTFTKDGLVYTRMHRQNDKFFLTLKLPAETYLNYWIVQLKDKAGKDVNIWDSGEGATYNITFYDNSSFKPGYFIFLAGFIPLVILYFKNRKQIPNDEKSYHFNIKDYVPQFDALRAIAVILVIIHHWCQEVQWLNFLPNGPLGVNIFFVLSGFLITCILMKAKNQMESEGFSKASVFKNFYIRRTLRIFPIYYSLLLIFWIIRDPELQKHGAYYFTYTSNYLFYSIEIFPFRLAHLWSLAVEEQFYLLWPWLIIIVNRKFLPYLIALFLIIGISSNFIFVKQDWEAILTPTCFDAFSIGAFLSYAIVYRQSILSFIHAKFRIIAAVVFFLFVLSVFKVSPLPPRTSHALLGAVFIFYCLFKNNNTIANIILQNKWLIKMGKISYGIYLYHLFVPELWKWINQQANAIGIDLFFNNAMPETVKPLWMFIQEFGFLILICIFSWNLIENPINNLKKKFDYKKPKDIQSAKAEVFSY